MGSCQIREGCIGPDPIDREPAVDLFLEHAETEYRKNGKVTWEYNNFQQALRSLIRMYHGCRVTDFGPKKLKVLQKALVDGCISRASTRPNTTTNAGPSSSALKLRHC